MSLPRALPIVALAAWAFVQPAGAAGPGLGTEVTEADLAAWDISIGPDGVGLPADSGSVQEGAKVYATRCANCHGEDGTGGPADPLVGGIGSLASDAPAKTVGSFWPYSTTLFDYVRRAMPYQAPGTLGVDETYAVTAYILSLNGLLPETGKLDKDSLPKVMMPNRDGFIPEPEFRTITNSK